jgi:hypothetical protein
MRLLVSLRFVISFEDFVSAQRYYLITESLRMFRSYKETGESGLGKINVALKIRNMIIDAIRSHSDINQLKQATETLGKLEEEQNQIEKRLKF